MSSYIPSKDYTKIPNQIIREPNLTPEEKAILSYIQSLSRRTASVDNIAKHVALKPNTVHRYKKLLKSQRVLDWNSGNSHKKSNEYYLNDPSVWKILPIGQKKTRKKPRKTSPSKGAMTSASMGTPVRTTSNTSSKTKEEPRPFEAQSPAPSKVAGSLTGDQTVNVNLTGGSARPEIEVRQRLREIQSQVNYIETEFSKALGQSKMSWSDPLTYDHETLQNMREYKSLIKETKDIWQESNGYYPALNQDIDRFLEKRRLKHWF